MVNTLTRYRTEQNLQKRCCIAIGFEAEGLESKTKDCHLLPPLAIAHMEEQTRAYSHYVLVLGTRGDEIWVMNPLSEIKWVQANEFVKSWTGKALILRRPSGDVTVTETTAPTCTIKLIDDSPEERRRCVLDFGTVEGGCSYTGRIRIVNAGRQSLLVSRTRSNCGCVVTGDVPQRIEPLSQGCLSVMLRTATLSGIEQKQVLVSLQRGEDASTTLTAVVEIRANIAGSGRLISRPQAISLTAHADDFPILRSLNVRRDSDEGLQLLRASSDADWIRVNTFTRRIEGREEAIIALSIQRQAPGEYQAQVSIETKHPKCRSIAIPISITVEREISICPAAIFCSMRKDETRATKVKLTSYKGTPFVVKDVAVFPESLTDSISVSWEKVRQSSNEIVVRSIASSLLSGGRSVRGEVRVLTDAPSCPRITIPVVMTVCPDTVDAGGPQ